MRVNEPITDHEIQVPEDRPIVSRTDLAGRITFVNQSFIDVSGFTLEELLGAPHNLVRHPHMPAEGFADLWKTIEAGRPWDGLVKNRCKNGDYYWVNANVTPVTEAGSITGYVSIRTGPSRAQIEAAEAAYSAIRAGTAKGIGLRDGELCHIGWATRLAVVCASVTGRLVLAGLVAVLAMALVSLAGRVAAPGQALFWQAMTILLGGGLVVASQWLAFNAVRGPIERLRAYSDAISRGDYAEPVVLPSACEFWQVTRILRALKAKLRYATLERLEREQRAEAEKRAALERMAETVERETGTALEEVGSRTHAMTAIAEAMTGSAVRTGASARSASDAMALARSNAQSVASAAEELSASIQEIGSQVQHSVEAVRHAVAAGGETRSAIEVLNEKVGRIGAIADVIGEIAAKTNLLALNATIEAARAGDAGKGFAVVAGEVKQLANQTARSTAEITRQLGEVRTATQASVDAVGRIESSITDINVIADAIARSVDQQSSATAEIARNVTETAMAADDTTTRVAEVSDEAEQTGQRATEVHENATSLAASVAELRRAVIRAVRTSTDQVNRREMSRNAVELACRVNLPGRGNATGIVTDLTEMGAHLRGPKLEVGARGVVVIDGAGGQIPFSVRYADESGCGLAFEADEKIREKLRALLARHAVPSAA